LFEYILYFFLTLIVSTLFAIIGLGSSLLLIPLFSILGVEFNLAKMAGLLANGTTTIVMSVNNIKSKLLDTKKIIPLIIITTFFAIFGAYSSNFVSQNIIKIIFLFFIALSLFLLYMSNMKVRKSLKDYSFIPIVGIMAIIAFFSGLIGVGGGGAYLPLLLYFGIKIKQSIAITSALIPTISFSAFFTYLFFVDINWYLLSYVLFGAAFGGYLGNIIMNKINDDKYLKIIIAILLVWTAIYMIYLEFLQGY